MIAKIFAVGSVAAMLLAGCCDKHCEENAQGKQTALPERTFEPLSLWNAHAPAKDSLEAFVRATTDSNSPDFIPAERCIAVFDWDGTLFMETAPTYFDWMLFEHRVLDDSTYKPTEQQLKAAREGREKKVFPRLSAPSTNSFSFKPIQTDLYFFPYPRH